MPYEGRIENEDAKMPGSRKDDTGRTASEHKAHVSGENKLERYQPAKGQKPPLGPRVSGD